MAILHRKNSLFYKTERGANSRKDTEQYGIERNFSFLKDPLIVNDMFLKKPVRIEVLGVILLMALLIWDLIEHVLRQHVLENDVGLPGWDNKKTPSQRIHDEHHVCGTSDRQIRRDLSPGYAPACNRKMGGESGR